VSECSFYRVWPRNSCVQELDNLPLRKGALCLRRISELEWPQKEPFSLDLDTHGPHYSSGSCQKLGTHDFWNVRPVTVAQFPIELTARDYCVDARRENDFFKWLMCVGKSRMFAIG
jgi:hypothetical protein